MVRTYAFNASSRSEIFEQYKHTAAAPRLKQQQSTSRSSDTVPYDNRKFQPSDSPFINSTANSMTDSSSSTSQMSNQENNNQYMNTAIPPLHQSNIYQSSFHSSMIDPLNSIVALRPIYLNGQLVYMPVEPHINMMINQQFGGMKQNGGPAQVVYRRQDPYTTQANVSRMSASQQYRQNTMNAKYGSLPNLSQKLGQEQYKLSSQEQHKLELQQQIEDNKRRKALEKQKEIELEQREIRKWEEYQKRIQEEDNREKRQIQEKARAIELRNQQVYERQQRQPEYQKERQVPKQRPPPQPQQEYYDSYDDEEPIHPRQQNPRQANSFSPDNSEQAQQPIRNRQQPRYEQQYNVAAREQRPDSSQPREVEWWEKKQPNKAVTPQSAVIPTLRGKPPAVPDSQRSGYDSSGNVGEHQSRPSSRTTSSTQRSSSDAMSEQLIVARNPSGGRKAPTAFTITA
ncbi:Protein CBG17207 [Caenorhabditis briggsae]|uniref:Protein CBG17207 n=1 Tax=Caenorhabditis briggsae TaxID=6238 RepID=A8XQK1_CAEBR|nr:Protein CBG17207 [Caenorhabditis briggsae]CAP34926.2 Protein CBG17207 [Caenorhabditis briggsae]